MGGMGDIGGGCWVCFQVDLEKKDDRKQVISAVDVPGAKEKKVKQVTIVYPVKGGGTQTLNVDLDPGQMIHIEWKH